MSRTSLAHRSRLPLWALTAVLALAMGVMPSTASLADDDVDPPRVLVYSGTQAYRHGSIEHGNAILADLANQTEAFTVQFTEDPADLAVDTLSGYDLVLFNSPSGQRTGFLDWPAHVCTATGVLCDRAPLDDAQRTAFIDWVGCGGGVVGIHQAMDAWHDWPEWDELVGMVFFSHFQAAEAEVFVTADHPTVTAFGGQGDSFLLYDEHYTFLDGEGPEDLSSDVEVVLGIGEFTDPGTELRQGAFYGDRGALAWTSTFRGQNRTFMTNLGHHTETWDMPEYQQHLLAGIAHVAEVRPDPACVTALGNS